MLHYAVIYDNNRSNKHTSTQQVGNAENNTTDKRSLIDIQTDIELVSASVLGIANAVCINGKHGFCLGQAGRVVYLAYSGLAPPLSEV